MHLMKEEGATIPVGWYAWPATVYCFPNSLMDQIDNVHILGNWDNIQIEKPPSFLDDATKAREFWVEEFKNPEGWKRANNEVREEYWKRMNNIGIRRQHGGTMKRTIGVHQSTWIRLLTNYPRCL